jgi:glycosyltransferase involved in cell wall biosynthesis
MTTISASLIVKNEASIMQRCLDSVSKWADEIIVMDTGSTDRTMDICAAHPKVTLWESEHFNKDTKIEDFQFNVAKNESISKCTGDWIIWWDADDFIDEEGAAKIRALAESTTADCLYTFICSYGSLRFEHCRMFRNGGGIEFDKNHSCHEYLNTGGRPQYLRKEIVVQHLPGKKGVPSAVRNTAIMEKDYFERGFKDQRTMFYLGNSYRETGRHDDAVKMYNEYLKVSNWKEERYFATLYKAQIHSSVGNFPAAFKALYHSFIEDDRFAESYCLMGDIMLHQKKYQRAKHWYELALELSPPEDSRLFMTRSSYDEYPRKKLEIVEEKLMMEAKQTKTDDKKPEPPKKVVKDNTQYKYILPEEDEKAAAAIAALSRIGKDGKLVAAIPNNEMQKRMIVACANLEVAEGNGMSLTLPDNLHDKGEVEWYCRAAGFILSGPFPEPINLEKENVA